MTFAPKFILNKAQGQWQTEQRRCNANKEDYHSICHVPAQQYCSSRLSKVCDRTATAQHVTNIADSLLAMTTLLPLICTMCRYLAQVQYWCIYSQPACAASTVITNRVQVWCVPDRTSVVRDMQQKRCAPDIAAQHSSLKTSHFELSAAVKPFNCHSTASAFSRENSVHNSCTTYAAVALQLLFYLRRCRP